MKKQWALIVILVVALAGFIAVGLVKAQGPAPTGAGASPALVSTHWPIQGRLTDAAGNPLEGDQQVVFRIYNVDTGGTPLCEITQTVSVSAGLFNTDLPSVCPGGSPELFTGGNVFLAVQVGSDAEMTPRQEIGPVPYALTVVPGAKIITNSPLKEGLHIEMSGGLSTGIAVSNLSTSGLGYGIWGRSDSSEGTAGYFENRGSGVGVYGESSGLGGIGMYAKNDTGTALRAESLNGTAIFAQGDVKQTLGGNGLVKAAIYAYCGDTTSHINYGFDNVSASGIMSIANGDAVGKCTLTLSFTLDERYIIASPTTTGLTTLARGVTTRNISGTTVEFFRYGADGNGYNGDIMIIIY